VIAGRSGKFGHEWTFCRIFLVFYVKNNEFQKKLQDGIGLALYKGNSLHRRVVKAAIDPYFYFKGGII